MNLLLRGQRTNRGPHVLTARNDALTSENKIHDDAVAKKFGFAGGLVPGVTVHGYLTWPAASEWGRAWLESGTISSRFATPVYDGEQVEVSATWSGDEMHIEVRNEKGQVCATAVAAMPDEPARLLDLRDFPTVPLPDPDARMPASPELLQAVTLGVYERTWHADRAEEYLDIVSDDLDIYRSNTNGTSRRQSPARHGHCHIVTAL